MASTIGATGEAVPNHATLIGGTDGTNLIAFTTDATGHIILGAGTAAIGTVDTELPAAVALTSTIVKAVSAPVVGAALLLSDGTNLVEGVSSSVVAGAQKVELATLIAGEDLTNNRLLVMPSYSFTNITTNTTTTVKSGAGVFHGLIFNKTTATGVVTLYDNTAASGTVIGTITAPAAVLANQEDLLYDVAFATGLTVVTATAAQDITIAYK